MQSISPQGRFNLLQVISTRPSREKADVDTAHTSVRLQFDDEVDDGEDLRREHQLEQGKNGNVGGGNAIINRLFQ